MAAVHVRLRYVMRRIFELDVPFIGVVERGAGNWLTGAVLEQAVAGRIVPEDYRRKVTNIIKRYGISDDFLFGCILEEGEYITPVIIRKTKSDVLMSTGSLLSASIQTHTRQY